MSGRLNDRLMPVYHFSETHSRLVRASPGALVAAVTDYRAESDPFYRVMIGLREIPMRILGKADGDRPPFDLRAFTVLARSETDIVYGLIGQFWKADFGLMPISDAAGFLASKADHAAKLTLAFWAEPNTDGRTRLVTQTRVFCPDPAVRLTFKPYWYVIRPVSGLIRRRTLAAIARACEG